MKRGPSTEPWGTPWVASVRRSPDVFAKFQGGGRYHGCSL